MSFHLAGRHNKPDLHW